MPMRNTQRATGKPHDRRLVGYMPLALAALLSITAAPTPSTSMDDIGFTLGRLHEVSGSSKTRRSLQLHAELRETCTGAGGVGLADKLMFNYRSNTEKFHRQSSEDWEELLATARLTCDRALLHVPATHSSGDGVASGISSLRVGAPDLSHWSSVCSELELRVMQRASNPFVRRRKRNDEAVGLHITARPATACRDREVEAQLRKMLQQAAREHMRILSHRITDQKQR